MYKFDKQKIYKMKNYLIIGASGGIGQAIIRRLLDQNHAVYATFCSNDLSMEHQNLTSSHFDVLDSESFGFDLPEVIDGLVYCPGTINLKPFSSLKESDFLHEFRVNVLGFNKVLKLALGALKKSDLPSVLGFSSVCAQNGFSFHASTAASKSALEGLFVSLAKEFSPKIRFNIIAPSIINTSLSAHLLNSESKQERIAANHPIPRVGSANDVSSLACHLISDDASWITGQVFAVDGGKSKLL